MLCACDASLRCVRAIRLGVLLLGERQGLLFDGDTDICVVSMMEKYNIIKKKCNCIVAE